MAGLDIPSNNCCVSRLGEDGKNGSPSAGSGTPLVIGVRIAIPLKTIFWTMSKRAHPVLPLLLAGVLTTFGAQAIPPPPDSFDGETIRCQLAGSAATVLICRDAELTAIDGKLRQAFRRLRDDSSLKQSEREALVEDQRRWVDSMDQCWRAQENLRACVKASQQQQLRQLESLMIQRRLMPINNDAGKGCEG
jgi:uncharacterized protein YecT (DUF1311 family)